MARIYIPECNTRKPSQVTLAENTDTPAGLILPNGEINWNCPCLGGMAVGPCGVEFRCLQENFLSPVYLGQIFLRRSGRPRKITKEQLYKILIRGKI